MTVIPVIWLVVNISNMDCSDEKILGPYANLEEAMAKLKDDQLPYRLPLAHNGKSYNESDVLVITGTSQRMVVFFDALGKRQVREEL